MHAFKSKILTYIHGVGEIYSLSRFSAVALSIVLHGSVFAAAFFTFGDFGRSEVTLPDIQEVIEVEFVEELPLKKEAGAVIVKSPKVVRKTVAEVSPNKKNTAPPSVVVIKPQTGQKASVSRGSFSRDRYVQKLTRHIASRKRYPKTARQRRMEGKVVVSFSLDGQGNLREASVVQSSKRHVLDNAAISTLRRSQPFPLPSAGAKHREMSFKIPISYSLKN